MKQALLIVNPYSGKKDGERVAAGIRERLEANGVKSRIFLSPGIDVLERFVSENSLVEFDFLGLIGGDGTMHSFLNAALRQYEQIPLPVALFPCGTGNAFNFDIGCKTVDETLGSIYANKIEFIDIAEVQFGNERLWSFNIMGCGLVADINNFAEKLRWLGASRYTVASLIKLLVNPRTRMRITTEQEQIEGRFSFVLACNTRYTGKGMMMAPRAQLNDGKFDVILVKACSAFKLLRLFPKIFKGEHIGAGVIQYLQTETLEVSTAGIQLPAIIDGESKGETPFSLKVHRDKLRVFVK